MSELCSEDSLEAGISLMEDSIDMLLQDDYPENPEQAFDFVRAYRRLSKQFQTIQKYVKED